MNGQKWGTVERVTYMEDSKIEHDGSVTMDQRHGPSGSGTHVLRIEFRGPMGDQHIHDLPNGGFSADNPALQFLAYIGAKPSDFEGQTLDGIKRQVPIVRIGEANYALSDTVLIEGAERLEDLVWSPLVDHDDVTVEDAVETDGSGSDDDGDGIQIERRGRGLTIHTE